MKVAKWGNSLAIRIPRDVAEALGLKEGDDVSVTVNDGLRIARDDRKARALARIRDLARPLPEGWTFDREEANAR